MSKYKDFAVVIPCYNEASAIQTVLENLITLSPAYIIVVDDCSTDNSVEVISKFKDKVTLLSTPKNTGGPGLPLKLGTKHAYKLGAKYVVTVDADNQHSKEDTIKVMDRMLEGNFVMVSGARIFTSEIPFSKKFSNLLVKLSFLLLYGINASDPFCGLRCYSRLALREIKFVNGFQWLINVNRFEQAYRAKSSEVNIEAIYTEYSLKKGLNLKTGLKIFRKMFNTRLQEIAQNRLKTVRINYKLNT